MGLLFSCCRRRKDDKDREPLLPKQRVDAAANEYLPSQMQLVKLADMVAALNAGKLPTQSQLNHMIRLLLRSSAFGQPIDSSYGTLSDVGKEVVSDFRELLESLLLLGLEKNDDDELQELIYEASRIPTIPVHADVIIDAPDTSTLDVQDLVGEIPSKEEVVSDAAEILQAIRQLSTILLTSSTFRIILSDLFKIARELVADAAADVGRIAATIETSAGKVEEAVRPASATLEDTQFISEAEHDVAIEASAVSEETQMRWKHLSTESPERTKEAIVGRIQQAIAQAHSNPTYQHALRIIFHLLQDYTNRLSNISAALADAKAPNITPIFWADVHLSKAVSHISALISRLASGHPLDCWIDLLRIVALDIGNIPAEITSENDDLQELRIFFSDLGSWFDLALDSPQYATSLDGQREAEALYDRARHLVTEASQSDQHWAQHVRDLFHETENIVAAIGKDRTTNRLIDSASALSVSLSAYTQTMVRTIPRQLEESKRRLRNQIQRDVLQWLLPRIIRALHVIPVPRVEFRSSSLDAVVDTLYLTPASAQLSLVPDHIRVQNWTELQLDMSETHPEAESIVPNIEYTGMQTRTKLRVSLQGIRVSARDIGYYACYRFFGSNRWLSWLGYEDEGLASVDVGARGATDEGLNLDVEVEFQTDSGDGKARECEPLFVVRDVKVDVPGLHLSLDRSKHWILNKLLLQPLAGPIGRVAAAWVFRSQVEAVLGSVSDLGGRVVWDAQMSAHHSRRELEAGDYLAALWRILSGPAQQPVEEAYQDNMDETQLTETHSSVTAKGFVRTSVTYPTQETNGTNTRSPVEESVLAIGVGEQMLPGKGGPHDTRDDGESEYGPRELAREALDQIQSRVDDVVEAEGAVVVRGAQVRQDVEDAAVRERRRERREATERGWKSDAFNI
ncbi:hypothetical protein BC835DRAFT_1339033 [Cytidiella melzeri]|nr:hypothetical protein BC835DRAFT_1339033 [Cytidiella melzeri]